MHKYENVCESESSEHCQHSYHKFQYNKSFTPAVDWQCVASNTPHRAAILMDM